MGKIVLFELKKIIKSAFFSVMIVGLALFIVLFYALEFMNSEKIFEKIVLSDQNIITNYEVAIQEEEDLINSGKLSKDHIAEKKQYIDFLIAEVKSAKVRTEGYGEKDWAKLLDFQIEEDKPLLENSEAFGPDNSPNTRGVFSLKTTIEQNKLILDRNIEPVFPIDYSLSVYDTFASTEDEVIHKEKAKRYSSIALYFQYTLYGLLFSVIGVVFFIFLFSDIFTREGLRDNGPIQLLYTQPVRRNNIFFAKVFTTVIATLLILIGASVLSLLTGSIFNRFGDHNYPLLIYGENETFTFMNLDVFLLKSLALFFMVLLFSYSLHFLFSVVTKNTMASLGGTIVVILVGIEMSAQPYLSGIAPYLPFNYFQVNNIISMESAVVLDNFNLTFTNGLLTLTVFMLILWFISNMLFRRSVKHS